MSTRYHYDEHGRYVGQTSDLRDQAAAVTVAIVVVPMALYFGLRWLLLTLLDYASLAVPYKWFVGYYYFTLVVPFRWADRVSDWVQMTPWPNLNLVLAIVAFLGVWSGPYVLMLALLRRLPGGARWGLAGAFGPLLALVLWHFGGGVAVWIFSS